MDKDKENISSFDDLVFAKRNKEYGAYQLRKRYNQVLLTGIMITVLLTCAVVIIPFLARPTYEKILGGGYSTVQVQMENLEPPDEAIYVPPAPPPPESPRIEENIKYVPPVVVDSVFPIDRSILTTDEALATEQNDNPDITGNGGSGDLISGTGSGDEEEPLFIVEVMPSFRGGDINKFCDYIKKRTNYPQEAVNANIRGTVYLTFIVEKDGSVSNVTVLKGVHPLLDNEAVKVISESPKWSPGLQRGQPVRVRFQIPLNFTL